MYRYVKKYGCLTKKLQKRMITNAEEFTIDGQMIVLPHFKINIRYLKLGNTRIVH